MRDGMLTKRKKKKPSPPKKAKEQEEREVSEAFRKMAERDKQSQEPEK